MTRRSDALARKRSGFVALFLCGTAVIATGASRAAEPAGSAVITADQRVTLSGTHSSLHALLLELGSQGSFSVRTFSMPDRPVSLELADVPLLDALRRLLGRDNFLVGTRGEPDGTLRVTWVSVIRADHDGASASASADASARALGLTPERLGAALGQDAPAREAATRAIEERIRANPRALESLLASNPGELATIVEGIPNAADAVAAFAARQHDPALRAKLEEVAAGIRIRQSAASAAQTAAPPD